MRLVVLLIAVVELGLVGSDRYHPYNARIDQDEPSLRESAAERSPKYWENEAREGIIKRLQNRNNRNIARNIVLFLGDGMSVPTLTAARILRGQRRGETGEQAQLAFEDFPSTGFAKTYCLNAPIPDSACTATAYLSGVKANLGTIGVNGKVPRFNCKASADPTTHVDSIAVWALKDGRDAGLVTTARVTHASPAAVYAHVANRHWENDKQVRRESPDARHCPDIAQQLVNSSPGNQLKVILGGGRGQFLPDDVTDEEGFPGLRGDKRNLIKEWHAHKLAQDVSHAYVWNREELLNLSLSPPEYLLGLFEHSHMKYHLEANKTTEPTLAELTEVAIRSLRRNKKGFFLFVESGRIDHGHHDNFVHLALDETIQLSNAVDVATKLLSDEDSLIVVTADHAHVMTFSGYKRRGEDILGASDDVDKDGVPFMTLSYSNGPGARRQVNGVRVNVTADPSFGTLRWRSHADVPLQSETHGGEDVGVFARGPHHDLFTGVYEQSQLPFLMAYAGCLGTGLRACDDDSETHARSSARLMMASGGSQFVRFILALYLIAQSM